jgi:hypothetical protein
VGIFPNVSPELSRFERQADEVLRESTLWPLWIVVIGHAVAFLAPAVVFSMRDRSIPSFAALAILLVGTGARVRGDLAARGGVGLLTRILLATWVLAGAAAWGAARWGVL